MVHSQYIIMPIFWLAIVIEDATKFDILVILPKDTGSLQNDSY